MSLLVIGNGFDLAIGWPTKYADFLNFIKLFRFAYNTEDYQKARIPKDCIGDFNNRMDRYPIKDEKEKLEKLKPFWDRFSNALKLGEANQVFRDFHFCIYNNCWIRYFEYRYDEQLIAGENWIDLEAEIKEVIKVLEDDAIEIVRREMFSYEKSVSIKEIITKIQNMKKENKKTELPTKLISHLREEFDKFVMALGIYIDFFVRNLIEEYAAQKDIYELLKIKDDKIDHVLSFNYRNNYNEKYNGVKQDVNNTCYVHGMVDYEHEIHKLAKNEKGKDYDSENIKKLIEKNKMIIGFDEYRDDDKKTGSWILSIIGNISREY